MDIVYRRILRFDLVYRRIPGDASLDVISQSIGTRFSRWRDINTQANQAAKVRKDERGRGSAALTSPTSAENTRTRSQTIVSGRPTHNATISTQEV